MRVTESVRARLWTAALSVLAIVAALLVVVVNPLEVALAYLVLLAALIVVGLVTNGWGGLAASVIGVFAIVLFNYYAGIYPRENTILNIASELVAFLLVGPVAGNLATAIDRVQRQADRWLALAEELTTHDDTFATLKPRWAQVRLEEEVLRAITFGRPLAVALLRLDKSQAAVESRAARVAALQTVIRLARAATRPPTVVAHVGGDEVLVILPEHTHEQASQFAATVQGQAERAPCFGYGDDQSLGKPLSEWGQVRTCLARLDSEGETAETLLARARAGLK